ncbi:hypothetical protein [Monoglobus pectinilyticus]|nr:hypothetical protein [Monoglobus pectinilyticus]MEE0735180.1 hypothetical protein [Monoglobus pectinilyticus]
MVDDWVANGKVLKQSSGIIFTLLDKALLCLIMPANLLLHIQKLTLMQIW